MKSDRMRILIVDDEPDHRLLIQAILTELISSRLELAEACDGKEALNLFETWYPNLILMDLWMPCMSGETAIRKIRALENQWSETTSLSSYRPPVRILVVTAATFECDRTLAFEAGCDDFICKPLDLDDFTRKLRGHLASLNPNFLEASQSSFWRSPLEPVLERLYIAS